MVDVSPVNITSRIPLFRTKYDKNTASQGKIGASEKEK